MTKEPTPEPESKSAAAKDEPVKTENKDKKKKSSFKDKLKSLVSTKKRRILVAIAGVIVIVGVLAAIPTTRYAIAGTVIKKTTTVTIVDSVTGKPVSDASVTLASKISKTNSKGEAKFSSVPVGPYKLSIEKKYFQTTQQNLRVPIFASPTNLRVPIKATGRPVVVKVVNKISTKPLEKATVTVSGTSAVTDKNGEASIVLPISTKPQTATIKSDGFNEAQLTVTVADKADQKAEVGLAPAGKIYFLSKRTGKIDVMKSNLDGTEQQTVVEGTGKEQDTQTVLLASRDWKYLALLARREGDLPKLYVIDTVTGQLKVIDEGKANFELVGWSDKRFIYKVDRHTANQWENKKQALKSYDVTTGKITVLDETFADYRNSWTYLAETIGSVYILRNEIAYIKQFHSTGYYESYIGLGEKHSSFVSIKNNGTDRRIIKEIGAGNEKYIDARLYAPEEVYVRARADSMTKFFEYEAGKIIPVSDMDDTKFYGGSYSTYLVSPSGSMTFWYEPRDGKNTLLVGNEDAKNSKEVASLSEYIPYGWFSDDYLLVSKAGSELYILSRDNPKAAPVKVSDYHKPQVSYPGYGYGYGGQ